TFFLSTRRPPTPTLFPYTTLFRSQLPLKLATLWKNHHARKDKDREAFGTIFLEDNNNLRLIRKTGGKVSIWWLRFPTTAPMSMRSEEHTSELQSRENLVCRLLLEK